MYKVGELVWVKRSLFSRKKRFEGWGLVISKSIIELEDSCNMISLNVLVDGSVFVCDSSDIRKFKFLNKHLSCQINGGSPGKEI